MLLNRIAISLLAIFIITGCATRRQQPAEGSDYEIIVVADESNWEIARPYLEETFEKVIYTPQVETFYQLRWVQPEDFEKFRLHKNLILISQLEVSSLLTPVLKTMLPDTTLNGIRNASRRFYSRRNAYADGQTLMIILGKSDGDLQARIRLNRQDLFDMMDQQTQKRLTQFIYRIGEQTELADDYFHQYGWYLRIMHDYVEIRNAPDRQFVWLGRDFPFRWIVVHWMDAPESFELQAIGEELIKKVYGTLIPDVWITEKYFSNQETWLNSHSAVEFRGLWEHKTEIKGGPFIAYTFYAPEQDIVFVLTGIVWAPDREKLPYIRQIEMMVKTFGFARPELD
ncbi:MAG: DUF4837 family protein [Lentisphaeria bacterium]|nr:DUF4837 family protein [Candidatus Neomarinimicrobiota bacterium]MCF7842688.1 DUF4837 family protein [Lentisphaeria bacterium]